jgi:hypothetical protein
MFRVWAANKRKGPALSPQGASILENTLSDHRAKHAAIWARHNAAVDAGRSFTDPWADNRAETALAIETWNKLKNALPLQDFDTLQQFIKAQKQFTWFSAMDSGLGEQVAERNREKWQRDATLVASLHPTMPGMPQGQTMTPNYTFYTPNTFTGGMNEEYFAYPNGPLPSPWTVQFGTFNVSNGVVSITGGGGFQNNGIAYLSNAGSMADGDCETVRLHTVPSGNLAAPSPARSYTNLPPGYIYPTAYSARITATAINFTVMRGGYAPVVLKSISHTAAVGDEVTLCAQSRIFNILLNGTNILANYQDLSIYSSNGGYYAIEGQPNSGGSIDWFENFVAGTATIAGQVTGSTACSPTCPTGAKHTPVVTINNTEYYGTAEPPTYGFNWTSPGIVETATWLDNPTPPVDVGEAVDCTIVGVIQGSPIYGLIGERAITLSQNTEVPFENGWLLAPQCTIPLASGKTSPDFDFSVIYSIPPNQLINDSAFFKGRVPCLRNANAVGQPWICGTTSATGLQWVYVSTLEAIKEMTLYGSGSAYYCTNFDNQVSGKPFP